ncbi:MAG TPA: DUF4149 domain-containing protein [Thermodesulfobacteriota bacterium]|nr:DUF4149 domain-containing protein [Thermodesulfobacteriota bacterium]
MLIALRFIYILSLIFWIGSIFFFSLIAGPSIFKILPRETAGNLVTDIFPKYYLITYICGGVAIITSILSWIIAATSSGTPYLLRIIILAVMLGLATYAGTVIRPQALEMRSEMRSLAEDSPRFQEVSKRFSGLHKRSVIVNGTVFLLGIAIVLITAYTYRE